MCGIVGFAVEGDAAPLPDRRVLSRMCDSIVHRGPDDEGQFRDEFVALGARRLAIIDVPGGSQPMTNEDGTVVTVFNGEIYNFRELRSDLEKAGHRFRTRSDTEIIVHAYEQWGDDFVKKLNGMFAMALYDKIERRVLLVRDHVGIKPLYYASTGGLLIWGSEIKALLASGLLCRELDVDALGQFIAWEYCPGETTLLKTVRKLLPGHLLALDLASGRWLTTRYWRAPEPCTDLQSDGYWIERVDETLKSAVRRQLVSDVPLGAFLSGGVDSSLVTAAMGKADTFSIGFEDSSYSELAYSSSVARHLGVRHVTETVKPDALELFDLLMHFMDDPIGDSSIFPTWLVSRLARREVTVSLSGDGGDELFGGYETYLAAGMAERYELLPAGLRKGLLEAAASRMRPTSAKKGAVNKLLRFAEGLQHDPALGHARWRLFLGDALKARLFTPEALSGMSTATDAHIRHLFADAGSRGSLGRGLYVDVHSYLPDNILTKLDRMSMAVSLESRVPFLDREMVELAFTMPDRLKLRGRKTKWVLKKVAERYLPSHIVHRSKEGFSAPLKHWIGGAHRGLMNELLAERRIREEGLFQWPEVRRLRDDHLSGRRNNSHQLWCIMLFQAWQDRWLRT